LAVATVAPVIADLLTLLVVPAFLVLLAAVVLWCASRASRRDRQHLRCRGGGRHRGLLAAGQ
jgi:cytochrome c-type biogenesis protein CcmH/NrfF